MCLVLQAKKSEFQCLNRQIQNQNHNECVITFIHEFLDFDCFLQHSVEVHTCHFAKNMKSESNILTLFFYKVFKMCFTVMQAKRDSGVIFCLHHYQGLVIDRSLVY